MHDAVSSNEAGCFRPMTRADVAWAAQQHAALMEHSVFAVFGTSFLERVYRRFAVSKHAVAYVYAVDGAAQAVIASTSQRRAFLRELLVYSGLPLAGLSLAAVLRSGACRRMLWRMPLYLGKTCRDNTPAEMIFITVSRQCRKKGVARELIRLTLDEFRRRQVHEINVSIESENKVIRDLLLDFGFEITDHFVFADKPNDLLMLRDHGRLQDRRVARTRDDRDPGWSAEHPS